MKSVIKEFCCGEKFRIDIYLNGEKEKELLRRSVELEDAHARGMGKEERKKFLSFLDKEGVLHAEELKQAYTKGIKLGILIGIECAEIGADK